MTFVPKFVYISDMLLINELFPNPIGKDSGQEFIEIFNSGPRPENLAGFFIKDKSGKVFRLNGNVEPGGFRVIWSGTSKISLNNSDEEIFLYGSSGKLIHKAGFLGQAKEGASFSLAKGSFIFTDTPTPGAQNKIASVFTRDEPSSLSAGVIYNNLSVLNLLIIILSVGFFLE